MPNKVPLAEVFSLSMTTGEKAQLEQLAYSHGATMSGFVRKLIRDAARANHERGHGTQAGNGPKGPLKGQADEQIE